jgi:FkbM family methyltransferase
MTINEIFCWRCYGGYSTKNNVVLDLGANIGLSSAFFLHSSNGSKVFLVEPNSFLNEAILKNLSNFDGARYFLLNAAAGMSNGQGIIEPGSSHSRYSTVSSTKGRGDFPIFSLEFLIKKCIDKFNRIDILKIDIEGSGFLVLDSLPLEFNIFPKVIFVEEELDPNLKLSWINKNYSASKNLSGIHVFTLRDKM